MQINFKKLHPAAVAPVYATAVAASIDRNKAGPR